jgi:2-polyprenyl-3-methyl-5-hydroxy-6-metoxy-1,4-benzoquinol methylase
MTDKNKFSKAVEIFNSNTLEQTKILDDKIKLNGYIRGNIFLKEIERRVLPGGKILDYGCGSGRISFLLASKGYDVVGMDPSSGLIKEANNLDKVGLKIHFEVIDNDRPFLSENHFDAIVCSSAIEFIPEPETVLDNFSRAIKQGGFLFISYPNLNSIWRTYAKIRFGKKYNHFSVQWNIWSSTQFRRLIFKFGFNQTKIIHFESVFDDYKLLRSLNRIFLFGTLNLSISIKK